MSIFSLTGFVRSIVSGLKGLAPGAPRVSYKDKGRYGYVVYESAEGSFELYYEFGGGAAVATIDAPKPGEWTAKTGFPLEQRESILHFIGQQTVERQTTGGSYTIEDYGLVIWESGRKG